MRKASTGRSARSDGGLSHPVGADPAPGRKRFAAIVSKLAGVDGVAISGRRGFSHGGLLVRGKMFAVLRHECLLLKLPEARVDSLIQSGEGDVFDAGKGRPMREWVIVGPDSATDWLALAREACTFVSR